MKVDDPGHRYRLATLDGDGVEAELVFVKREGEIYPGNHSSYPGTTIQEVLRAVEDRLNYLQGQIPDSNTAKSGYLIREVLHMLEIRAAERHGRKPPTLSQVMFDDPCPACLHVGCKGNCKRKLEEK